MEDLLNTNGCGNGNPEDIMSEKYWEKYTGQSIQDDM